MILGAVDIALPHQDLTNPVFDPDDDPDRQAFGDLPYACEHAYSRRPQDFLGVTRVVGRLPDLTGGSDPAVSRRSDRARRGMDLAAPAVDIPQHQHADLEAIDGSQPSPAVRTETMAWRSRHRTARVGKRRS